MKSNYIWLVMNGAFFKKESFRGILMGKINLFYYPDFLRSLLGFCRIVPIHLIYSQIAVNCLFDRWEEILSTEFAEKAVTLETIFYRPLHFCEAQFHTRLVKRLVQGGQRVCSGDIHVGDGCGRHHDPFCGRWRIGDRKQNMFVKSFRIGKEQGSIPTEQYEPWNTSCLGMPRDVVIAMESIHVT